LDVKRFRTIFFACALLAALPAVRVNAQPVSPSATSQPAQNAVTAAPSTAPAPAETDTEPSLVPEAAPTLFTVLGLPVTNSMVCTWIVAALIFVIIRVTTWRVKEVPDGGQNFMETLIEGWENLMGNVLDQRVTRWVFPFATTFFIFIVISNFVDLVPGVGSIGFGTPARHSLLPFTIESVKRPFFRPPTTDANLPVAMAAIFLVMSLFWAVRYNGFWGLIKHIFGVKMDANKWLYPLFWLLFIFIGAMELLSILFVRPVALAMRLYGNIFGGESVLEMMLHHDSFWLSVLTSLPFYFYEMFVCVLQAFVFALLTVAFVGTLCTHADEEHGH
jgi:F-type H+-transporting ATPase subunit a